MEPIQCELGSACFFSGLTPEKHADLEKRLIKNKYRKGQMIIHEGTRPHGVFLILQGKTKSYKANESGRQLILRLDEPGALVGYRALLLNISFEETVEAVEDSLVGYFDIETFHSMVRSDPTLNTNLIRLLARELGKVEDRAIQFAYQSAHGRLASVLVDMKPVRNGAHGAHGYVLPALLRQDLAELAGLAVETTIRALKDMEASRIIHLKGREISVLDADRLASLCMEPT